MQILWRNHYKKLAQIQKWGIFFLQDLSFDFEHFIFYVFEWRTWFKIVQDLFIFRRGVKWFQNSGALTLLIRIQLSAFRKVIIMEPMICPPCSSAAHDKIDSNHASDDLSHCSMQMLTSNRHCHNNFHQEVMTWAQVLEASAILLEAV